MITFDNILGVLICGISAALPVLFGIARIREWLWQATGAVMDANDDNTYYQEH